MGESPVAIEDPARPRRNPSVEEQPMGEEVMLYQPDRGQVGVLNATARFIWDRCDGQHTAAGIAAELADAFTETASHDLARQVAETIEKLRAGGLLVEAEGG